MVKIFISYRRADSQPFVDRLYDHLISEFDQNTIFKDVDSIKLGQNFKSAIEEAIQSADVVLILMGKSWATITASDGSPRLDSPEDMVRLEVEEALRHGKIVIPVLVDSASMPQPSQLPTSIKQLCLINAAVLRNDPDFVRDFQRLVSAIKEQMPSEKEPGFEIPQIAAIVDEPNFDMTDAIENFYEALESWQWNEAAYILQGIEHSQRAPTFFDIPRLKLKIEEEYKGASIIENEEHFKELEREKAEKEYGPLRIMSKYEPPDHVLKLLGNFWLRFPNYDPDNLLKKLSGKIEPTGKDIGGQNP